VNGGVWRMVLRLWSLMGRAGSGFYLVSGFWKEQ
jgi:hypothetical protein